VSNDWLSGKYKAIIYDCDGVMFDSRAATLAFYDKVMAFMGRPYLDRKDNEQLRFLHSFGYREVLRYFFPDDLQWNDAVRFVGTIDYRELFPFMKMESGFRETLNILKPGFELAVCTNRSISTESLLESFDLSHFFAFVMTAEKVQNPKPHPEPLIKILEHYRISSEEALFVGDSLVDCMAAAAACVPFVAYRNNLPSLAHIDHHQEILELIG
jgi:phosphoglycolate phosphatase